jgi:hypothetical protein
MEEERGTDVLMAKQACRRTWRWPGSLSAAGAASIILLVPATSRRSHALKLDRAAACRLACYVLVARGTKERGRMQGRHRKEEGGEGEKETRRKRDERQAAVGLLGWVAVFLEGGRRVASCRLATARTCTTRAPHVLLSCFLGSLSRSDSAPFSLSRLSPTKFLISSVLCLV